jgi:hypothetical protein
VDKEMGTAQLRTNIRLNNRLRLEFHAGLSKLFRDHGIGITDKLLAELTLADPQELMGVTSVSDLDTVALQMGPPEGEDKPPPPKGDDTDGLPKPPKGDTEGVPKPPKGDDTDGLPKPPKGDKEKPPPPKGDAEPAKPPKGDDKPKPPKGSTKP